MRLQGRFSIERMCELAGVSRAGLYRSLQGRAPVEADMEVRSVIQQIAVEHRRCYRSGGTSYSGSAMDFRPSRFAASSQQKLLGE